MVYDMMKVVKNLGKMEGGGRSVSLLRPQMSWHVAMPSWNCVDYNISTYT